MPPPHPSQQLGLPNNKVVINGGLLSFNGPSNPTMEVFDPASQTVTTLSSAFLKTMGYNVAYPAVRTQTMKHEPYDWPSTKWHTQTMKHEPWHTHGYTQLPIPRALDLNP